MNGHSKIRNKGIANIFSQMGLVEAWGSGIKRILNALRVLTPQLMQGLMGLEGFMEIQIAGNMVAVAIKNDRDLFELSNNGRDNGDMEEYRQKFRDELSDILKVIDVFGMNTDLFQ